LKKIEGQITIRVDQKTLDRIEEIKDETERDRAKVLRKILKDYFALIDRGEVDFETGKIKKNSTPNPTPTGPPEAPSGPQEASEGIENARDNNDDIPF